MSRVTLRVTISVVLLAVCGCEKGSSRTEGPAKDEAVGGAEAAPIKTVAVADGIYMLVGRGGNVGVSVGEDGVLLIDDKFEDLARPIREAVAALSKGKIVYVLNTHHHGDHTGGNAAFSKDATLVSHENARKNLVTAEANAEALPVVTFNDEMSIHFNGQEIRLVHLPNGHTNGDSAVYFTQSNVVHLGDNFFNGKLPFVDLDNGGDPLVLLESTTKLLAELPPDTKIIPGHGDLAGIADYKAFHAMLEDTIATVRKAKAGGATVDAVKKAGFEGKYKAWASSFVGEDKWAETIYRAIK